MNFVTFSRKGIKTKVNEDGYFVPQWDGFQFVQDVEKKGYLFVVCDGMGGHKAGNVASYYCSKWIFKEFYDETDHQIKDWFEEKITQINNRIYKLSEDNFKYRGMGTTLVTLLIKDNYVYISNVGDSRVYQYSENNLKQITEDHSIVWEYYDKGLITKDDIIKRHDKNIITQAIGTSEKPKINFYKMKLPEKYIYMLCTDGLTDVLIDKKIEEAFKNQKRLHQIKNTLYDLSQINNSYDDVTIVIVSNYLKR